MMLYQNMRKIIGFFGFMLPLTLIIINMIAEKQFVVLNSISAYYYSNVRDILVGVLFIITFFLFNYKGYDKLDNIITNICGLSALLIAIFPMSNGSISNSIFQNQRLNEIIHFSSATLLFICFSFMSIFLFTKSDKKILDKRKKNKNYIFIACGILIILSIIIIGVVQVINNETFNNKYHFVLWFETLALCSFGISWLTKADVILKN